MLFNKTLPLESARKSEFTLDKNSDTPLIMQTAIGQGNTLVSPVHMAMSVSAIANDGELMKPYLIDKVVNDTGDLVKQTKAESYKRLMSSSEAELLQALMEDVTEYGTATALSGRGYQAAGKTGSAEYDEYGSSHSWFVGYCEDMDGEPGIAVAIIVEGGGTGSEAAVPIAAQIFDTWYWS